MMPATSQTPAKSPEYSLRHYTSDNGLPQNSVGAIAMDRDNFIWLATSDGLVRFDGRSFLTFNKAELGGATNIFVGFLQNAGSFYAVTDNFGYVKIDAGRAVTDKHPPVVSLSQMFKTKEGPRGLTYAMGFPDRFNEDWFPSRSKDLSKGNWLPTQYVLFDPDSNGNFFKWQKDGRVDYYKNWKKQKSYPTHVRLPHGIFRVGKSLYNDDRAGNIELLATDDGTISTQRKIKLVPAHRQSARPDLSKSYVIYSQDLSGDAFIYQDQKLYQLSQQRNHDLETTVLLDGFDFRQNNVASVLFDDKHQRLYLGTLSNGLFILDFHAFRTLIVENGEPTTNIYYAQTALSDSTVITPSLNVLGSSTSGQPIAYRLPPPIREFPMTWKSMLKARSGDIWCLKHNILYCFDGNVKKLKGQWDAGGEISHLYEDRRGRIWLGTRFVGLRYIDPSEKSMPIHTFTQKITGISYILEEGADMLWVGTGTGLFKINLLRKAFSLVPDTKQYYIRSILIQPDGELWFTTYEHGLFLYQNNKLHRFPLDKDHYLSNAHCLVGDTNGYFWLPTNHGLFRIYRQDLLDFTRHRDSTRLYYHHYLKQNGFRIDEFNGGCQPCAVRLHSGYVSLPSIDGLVFFKPEQVPVDIPRSKIFIDRIEANSRNVPFSDSKVELSAVSDLKVFVSSPYLGDRENQQLYYAISSEEHPASTQTWYPIEKDQQSILLNSLTSGTYTLKIRKNTGFGPNSLQLTTLAIVIPYQWYETWPFKISVVVLMLIAIYFYFKGRLKKAHRLNKILESRVSEKTRSLQDTLSVLKTSEQELLRQTRLQMHLIASISHDIRSPLRSIEFTSAKLSGLIQSGDYTLAETVGTSVNESSRKILTLLENMLSYVKSQFSDSSVVYENFVAHDLVEEVALIFKQAFAVQHNRFNNNVPETVQVRSNRQLLKIILHNLIDNANKYTSEGSVSVSLSENRGVIALLVTDTGPGLPKNILHWFNNGDAAYTESPGGGQGIHGIGLVIVKELAEILKVDIKVTSNPSAQFSITFSERD